MFVSKLTETSKMNTIRTFRLIDCKYSPNTSNGFIYSITPNVLVITEDKIHPNRMTLVVYENGLPGVNEVCSRFTIPEGQYMVVGDVRKNENSTDLDKTTPVKITPILEACIALIETCRQSTEGINILMKQLPGHTFSDSYSLLTALLSLVNHLKK